LDTDFDRARFPHKFYDYFAAGRPVLVNDVGDVGQLVRDRQLGVVAEPDTPFAQLVAEGLAARDKWDEWGDNARRTAENLFAPERAHAQLNLLLKRVLGDARTWLGEPYKI